MDGYKPSAVLCIFSSCVRNIDPFIVHAQVVILFDGSAQIRYAGYLPVCVTNKNTWSLKGDFVPVESAWAYAHDSVG